MILTSVVAAALETVPQLMTLFAPEFMIFDIGVTMIFTAEYIARVWVAAEADPDRPAWRVRLEYMRSPMALIDLIAILPFYLTLFLPADLQVLRVLRLLRIYKLARYSPALTGLMTVIRDEAATLLAAFSVLTILLILAAVTSSARSSAKPLRTARSTSPKAAPPRRCAASSASTKRSRRASIKRSSASRKTAPARVRSAATNSSLGGPCGSQYSFHGIAAVRKYSDPLTILRGRSINLPALPVRAKALAQEIEAS
nr:ion transporter [Marivivens donghaensis]